MTSIKQQIEHAEAGQVIPVIGPHRIDNIRWDVPVRLVGDGSAVFYGDGAKRALRYTGAGRLTIEGIRFVDYVRAIELLPSHAQRIRVIGCDFEGCGTAVYGGTNDARTIRCDDIELSDLYLRGCTDRAISISTPFRSCRVRHSTIDGGGQGAVWLGSSDVGINHYDFASVSDLDVRKVHAPTDCKGVMMATIEGSVLGSRFSDVGATQGVEHASDTCSAYFKCERAIASHNTFNRACGVVAKESCDLTVDANLFWTDVKPHGIWRDHVRAISTTSNATVNAYGNQMWGMVVGLASGRRSSVRDNFLHDVPLYKPWGFDQPVAVFYESGVEDFHDITNNRVPNGVLQEWRHR